jgi:hypothetical protein
MTLVMEKFVITRVVVSVGLMTLGRHIGVNRLFIFELLFV